MANLNSLLQQNKAYVKELHKIKENLQSNLGVLSVAIEPIFTKYKDCFEELKTDAEGTGFYIPEISEEGFGFWGNEGLKHISYDNKGFAILYTNDFFGGLSDSYEAYIPCKYLLADNAEELIMADVKNARLAFESFKQGEELECTIPQIEDKDKKVKI